MSDSSDPSPTGPPAHGPRGFIAFNLPIASVPAEPERPLAVAIVRLGVINGTAVWDWVLSRPHPQFFRCNGLETDVDLREIDG